jgi:hypothetical protein
MEDILKLANKLVSLRPEHVACKKSGEPEIAEHFVLELDDLFELDTIEFLAELDRVKLVQNHDLQLKIQYFTEGR